MSARLGRTGELCSSAWPDGAGPCRSLRSYHLLYMSSRAPQARLTTPSFCHHTGLFRQTTSDAEGWSARRHPPLPCDAHFHQSKKAVRGDHLKSAESILCTPSAVKQRQPAAQRPCAMLSQALLAQVRAYVAHACSHGCLLRPGRLRTHCACT